MHPSGHSARAETPLTVLTVGHSTRASEDFIRLLQVHRVTRVVDVRAIPHSRHNAQFDQKFLSRSLREAGISYTHLAGLGGLRHTTHDSPNLGWRNESLRGFADYMQTSDFERGLRKMLQFASKERIALMCAEAVPWACHRALIADALLVRGIRTRHIMSLSHDEPHTLTSFAKVRGRHVTYPPEIKRRKQPQMARRGIGITIGSDISGVVARGGSRIRSTKRTQPGLVRC
jgi:uncharacterized protein (DUF488 family)